MSSPLINQLHINYNYYCSWLLMIMTMIQNINISTGSDSPLTVSKGTNDFSWVSVSRISIVQHGCCSSEVHDHLGNFCGNHHATVDLLCNGVAITAILGRFSKLWTLSASGDRDQITSAPPQESLPVTKQILFYIKIVLFYNKDSFEHYKSLINNYSSNTGWISLI
jgi:hypothetical protein